jgi:signal transduction histidine kinase/CheY-like chemotaxis protein
MGRARRLTFRELRGLMLQDTNPQRADADWARLERDLALAREDAAANSSRLKLALKAARAGVYEYDYTTHTLWTSPEVRSLTGRDTLDDFDPQGGFSLYHKDDRPLVADLHRRARSTPVAPVDVRLTRQEGDRWVRLSLEVEKDAAGLPIRATGLMLDISAHKRQELALIEACRTAEVATAARSDFLASVSHEIRTPMNGIVGVLNLLKREPLSDQGHSLLGEAIDCSDMLAQLINDVLDFSKIEAGKLELSPTVADPLMVVEAVTNLMRAQAETKGLYLRLTAQDGIGSVSVDSVRLRQCLFNLVGNAIKFTERGGVDVRLSVSGQGAQRRLRCEIADTGIGVAEEARATLFDRFQQANRDITRRFGGTGLGLAISNSIVRMMGGELDFRSRPGQGSTFWFEIPAPQVATMTSSNEDPLAGAPLTGLLILVVDDNRINRLVAVKSLEALGAEAEAVDNGAAAIKAVDQTNFDLVLMDINMPEMDGMEATRRIRALPSQASATPVIALTADVMSHQRQSYRIAGMDGVVAKPFSPAQLLSEIARIAERSDEDFAAVG